MKELAISVQTLGWYYQTGWETNPEKAFEFIKGCGFEALDYGIAFQKLEGPQIKVSEKGEFFTKSIEEILEYYAPVKAAMEKTGIYAAQAHAPFPLYSFTDPEYNEYLLEVVEKCMAVCQYLSIPALVIHPVSHLDKDIEKATNLKMYRRMIPWGKKYGVKMCLENMFTMNNGHVMGTSCSTAEETVWYIDTLNGEAGYDAFGYCFDLGHANIIGANIPHFVRTLGHRLTVLHLHDNDGIHDQHLAPMTQKKTDWDGLIKGLRDINYRGAINFETSNSLKNYPEELRPLMLNYIAGVGKYIRDKLLKEEK